MIVETNYPFAGPVAGSSGTVGGVATCTGKRIHMVITPYEMKEFIIATLGLEDLTPEGIGDDEPLFAGGLGLDSIDALELGIALRKRFKVQAAEQDPALKDHFRSVRSLVDFVAEHGQGPLEAGA